jgi:hypothetical protein
VSHDLRTWESAEMRGLPDTSSDRLLDVAIGEGGIVVVGLADAVLFSDEGRDWKRVALPTGSSLRADTETSVPATDQATSVVVGGPGFVAVGTHMWISRDGRNWSVAKIGHPFGHRTHLATNGRSLLVLDGDDVWISADGEDWIEHPGAVPAVETGSEATRPGRRPEQINALLGTTDGYFLTEGLPVRFGGPGMVWRSEDGIHWSQVTLPESGKSSAGVLALAHDEGRYVALIVDDQVLTSIAGGPVIAWTPEGLGVVRR